MKTFAWPQVVTCHICPGGARAVPAGYTVEAAQHEHVTSADHLANRAIIAACGMYQCAGQPGPGHWPSPMCRSGKRPHCTCDACY